MHKRLERLLCLILSPLLIAQSILALPPEVKNEPTAHAAFNLRSSAITTVTIPKNTEIKLVLLDTVSSATAEKGQSVHLAVASDVIVDGVTVLPAGTLVLGEVSRAIPAVPNKRQGVLKFMLDSIPLGQQKRLLVTDHPRSISRGGKTRPCTNDQICVMNKPITKMPRASRQRKASEIAKAIVTAPIMIPLSIVLVPLMAIGMWNEGGSPNGTDVMIGICSERSFYVRSAETIRVTYLQTLARTVGIADGSCRLEIPPTL